MGDFKRFYGPGAAVAFVKWNGLAWKCKGVHEGADKAIRVGRIGGHVYG